MLFTKSGAENITVINSQGVRSAQCNAQFDLIQKLISEPTLNFSVVVSTSTDIYKYTDNVHFCSITSSSLIKLYQEESIIPSDLINYFKIIP